MHNFVEVECMVKEEEMEVSPPNRIMIIASPLCMNIHALSSYTLFPSVWNFLGVPFHIIFIFLHKSHHFSSDILKFES